MKKPDLSGAATQRSGTAPSDNSQTGQPTADLESLKQTVARLGAELATSNKRLALSEAECQRLQQTVLTLTVQTELYTRSLRFRIGDTIVRGVQRPRAMVKLPLELWRLYRSWRSQKDRLTSIVSAQPAIASPPPAQQGLMPAPVQQSSKPARSGAYVRPYPAQPGRSHVTQHLASEGGSELPLTREPLWLETPVTEAARVDATFHLMPSSDDPKAALCRVEFLGADGEPLEQGSDVPSGNIGHYVYLDRISDASGMPAPATLSLRVPAGSVRMRLGFQSWNDDACKVSNAVGLTLLRPGVTVVVPVYKARDRIRQCLDTLRGQTLDARIMEILLVINGPEDGTRAEIEKFRSEHPGLDVKVLSSEPAGAGRARNAGIVAASREFTAFLDDDDELSPGYLEGLFKASDGDAVVVTAMLDKINEEVVDSPINSWLKKFEHTSTATYRDVGPVFSLNAAKMTPTRLMRRFAFDPDLRSGEDVVFWSDMCTRAAPRVTVVPQQNNAHYIRHLRENSISRMPVSYDFNISQRLEVIKLLDEMRADPSRTDHKFLEQKIEAQLQFSIRYLQANPQDYVRAMHDLRQAGMAFPVERFLNAKLSKTLVIAFCFPPYIDASGIVMAKRIAALDHPVDVISNSLSDVRQADDRLMELVSRRVGFLEEVKAPAAFAHWPSIERFVEAAGTRADDLESSKGAYTQLYSRALWPASHFAAAVKKLKNPHIVWTAEFSDPILKDIKGLDRPGQIDAAWLRQQGFEEAFRERGIPYPLEENRLFFWCEALATMLADHLVFTNRNQLDYMLSYQPNDFFRQEIERKAIVSPHPTISSEFYEIGTSNYELDSKRLNIGYFGSFYETRGVGAVVDAIGRLPAKVRSEVALHIFTGQHQKIVEDRSLASLVGKNVYVNDLVGYIDYLALTRRFDVLLVMDAETGGTHLANPFLPSKLSDYLGSGRNIWALVEQGSPMDRLEFPAGSIKTDMHDKKRIAEDLRALGSLKGEAARNAEREAG